MTRHTILCVDDEQAVLDAFRRNLRGGDFDLCFARSGEEALEVLARTPAVAVILSDLRMPGMGGIALLEQVSGRYPDITRVMLTGNADQQSAIDAVNRGHVFSFQNKPCAPDVLAATLRAALAHHDLRVAERELLEQTLAGSVRMLIEILSSGQPALYGRAMKVRAVALELAGLAGPGLNTWQLGMAALLQPIGWAVLPAAIVEKHLAGGALDRQHQDAIEGVGAASARLLHLIPRLGSVADIILHATDKAEAAGPRNAETALLWLANQLVDEAPGTPVDEERIARLPVDGGLDLRQLAGRYRSLHGHAAPQAAGAVYDDITVVRPAQLQAGDVVRADVRYADNTLALAAGSVLSAFQIERLEMHYMLERIKGTMAVRRQRMPPKVQPAAA
jgi:CheY-like chemotaxis protein